MSRGTKPPLITVLLAVLFAGAVVAQFVKSLSWGHDDWGMTEWLVNYAGGFVRRGLPGEFVFQVARLTGVQANYLVLTIAFTAFVGLTVVFLIRAKGSVPACLILSPVLLAAPAYQQFIVRKDTVGILLLVACLALNRQIRAQLLRLAMVNAVAVVAVLSHESFFFFGFPALVLAEMSRRPDANSVHAIAASVAKLLPVAAALMVAAMFHGSPAVAQAINGSWLDLWRQVAPEACCLETPGAAIDAVQWTTTTALSYPARTLTEFSHGIYVPLAWLLTIVLCAWFMVGFVEASVRRRLATILIVQLITIAPLFVLGWDYGRWIFLWTASALAIFLYDVDFGSTIFGRILERPAALLDRVSTRLSPVPGMLLIFGVPSCCWTTYVYVNAAPLGYYYRMIVAYFA